jgi:SPP1 family predicted phage head-tail adaptor
MAILTRINGQRRLLAAGDLTCRIDVQLRTLQAPSGAGADVMIAVQPAKTVWAMLVTNSGQEFFDNTNLKAGCTHIFYIRFIPDAVFPRSGRLSAQEWVKYKGREFKILSVENLEERDEFLALCCNERGAQDVPVNLA